MKGPTMRTRPISLLLSGLLAACAALAQPFPNKPIKFVVGYPPGGSGDFVTRTVGEAIAAELGQTAVIDNRPGAAGNLASEVVNKSPADGYTLLVGSNPYINKALYKKLPYDIEKDFQPITLLGNGPMVIAVNSSLPVNGSSPRLWGTLPARGTRPCTRRFIPTAVGNAVCLVGQSPT